MNASHQITSLLNKSLLHTPSEEQLTSPPRETLLMRSIVSHENFLPVSVWSGMREGWVREGGRGARGWENDLATPIRIHGPQRINKYGVASLCVLLFDLCNRTSISDVAI